MKLFFLQLLLMNLLSFNVGLHLHLFQGLYIHYLISFCLSCSILVIITYVWIFLLSSCLRFLAYMIVIMQDVYIYIFLNVFDLFLLSNVRFTRENVPCVPGKSVFSATVGYLKVLCKPVWFHGGRSLFSAKDYFNIYTNICGPDKIINLKTSNLLKFKSHHLWVALTEPNKWFHWSYI